MRVEPTTIGSIIHIVKRGARNMDIVVDDSDRYLFLKSIFLLNDSYRDSNWHRVSTDRPLFERPAHWPERKPLVHVLAWALMTNHFHILLEEIQEGGSATFMQRLGGSMTLCFNSKYRGQGSIFQGGYKGKVVKEDKHLRYLAFYIMVKNILELYPGGLRGALDDFDVAWQWALENRFSSLSHYVLRDSSPVFDKSNNLMMDIFDDIEDFKKKSRELLKLFVQKRDNLSEEVGLD